MNRTKIEWCDYVWNPVVGCTGSCPYCYARKMAHRFHRDFTPHWVESNFQKAMSRKPSRIFVNSMSDLADWHKSWYLRVLKEILSNPQHLFLFLSKQPWKCEWFQTQNAMLGYSVTRQMEYEALLDIRAYERVSFLSLEPLLEPINLASFYHGPMIRWIIVGAETGNRKGRVVPEPGWIKSIYEYATDNGIPLFFKESLRPFWPFDGYNYFPQEYPA